MTLIVKLILPFKRCIKGVWR